MHSEVMSDMLNGDTRTSKKYLAFLVSFLDERSDKGKSADKGETLIPLRAESEIIIP